MRLSLTLEDKAVPYFHFIPVEGSPDDTDEGQRGEIEYQSFSADRSSDQYKLWRFETEAQAGQPVDDIREVSNYVDAMMYGLERLETDRVPGRGVA
jgi:hypothetical protein